MTTQLLIYVGNDTFEFTQGKVGDNQLECSWTIGGTTIVVDQTHQYYYGEKGHLTTRRYQFFVANIAGYALVESDDAP